MKTLQLLAIIGCAAAFGPAAAADPAPAPPATPPAAGDGKAAPAAPGAEPAGKPNPAPDAKSPAAPERSRLLQTGSLDALFKLVPVGRTHSGVKYPVMDDGALTALVESERMTRTDENSLSFENAVIDQKGTDPMTFRLIAAVYNRASNLLMSSQPSVIESPTYRIEGDSLAYDRGSGNSRMVGRVRMMIFDTGSLDQEPQTPNAGEAKTEANPDKKAEAPAPPPAGTAPASPAK